MDGRRIGLGLGFAAAVAALAVVVAAGLVASDGDDDDPAPARASCADGTLESRHYILCTAGDAEDQQLVVALHGRNSSAAEMRAVTRLERAAAPEHLAVVYPDAVDPAAGWGDDTFPTPTRPAGDEDVVFLDRLVDELQADPAIADGPVGLVGFSNGASMALRYAAQRPDTVEAVVSVAGQLPRDPAVRPAGPVPLMEVYGTADPLRGFDTGIPDNLGRAPGGATPTLSTPDTVAAFVTAISGTREGAAAESDPDPADGTSLRTETWTGEDGDVVVLHTIVGGGHTWPSGHAPFAAGANYGPVSGDLDASAEAVTFILSGSRS